MRAFLVGIAVAAAALISVGHASAHSSCTRSRTPFNRTFCGPAKATLKLGNKKYYFRQGGQCSISDGLWTLGIGTVTLSGKPRKASLTITVFSKKAGTHGAAVQWQLHGQTNSLYNAKVTLAKGLKKGTFTGSRGGGHKVTGSFTCK
jgi:hypothetical protein